MNKIFVAAALGLLAFASCSKSSTSPANTAGVLFFNGCIPSALAFNADGNVNNSVPNGASGIALLKNTTYLQVASGSDSISFKTSGQLIAGGAMSLATGSSYSAFLGGSGFKPFVLLQSDDLTAPASGDAKIRFVNLSPDSIMVNCNIATTKYDSNVGYKTITPFLNVPAGSGLAITLQNQANTAVQALLTGQNLLAGKIYTVVLTGSSALSGTSGLTLTMIGNN